MAWTAIGAAAWVAFSSASTLPARIAVAGSVTAGTAGFLLEDPASVTMAPAPTSLAARRRQRAAVGFAALGAWWMAAMAWTSARGVEHPPAEVLLQIAALAGVALAAAAIATRVGELSGGGLAGLVLALAFYATSLLPPQVPFRFPPDATSTEGLLQNAIVTITSIIVLSLSSRDPAERRR